MAYICNARASRQRQVDPWALLASQSSLLGEFLVIERPCVKKPRWVMPKEQYSKLSCTLHTPVCD